MSRPGGRRVRRAAAGLAVGLAALLGVGACTGPGRTSGTDPANSPPSTPASAPRAGSAVPASSTLHWHSCARLPSADGAPDCTTLSVPLNYADPGGRHISLALDMVPATAPPSQRQGIMLVNPGGPGASGLWLAPAVAGGLSRNVAARYDIVGFDPRGVGSSVPALSCDPGFFAGPRPDYIPATAAAEQVLINRAKTYASDCERRFGWLLPHMTTQDVARDMDVIRAAFGVPEISYYGFSYGTYIGQVYATVFPGHLSHMVLDSTVDPTGAWYADNIDQDYAFQKRMEAFFAWMAEYDDRYGLGGTAGQVQAAFYRARDQLLAHPADGMIGADEFDDTFQFAGYYNWTWPGLARALSSYLNSGDAADLAAEYRSNGAQNENEFAVYNAVECSDANWPRSWARWHSDTEQVYRTAPFMAWDNAWFNAACAFWPVQGPPAPPRINGTGLPGILMLQGTLDAATPYPGAQDAHKLLPSARMVVAEGDGNHGQSFDTPANSCIQGYVNSYLAAGTLPQAPGLVNATCPALPAPTP